MAVSSSRSAGVLEALPLQACTPSPFAEGIAAALAASDPRGPYFVSPPVDGWTLVVGNGLPPPENDPPPSYAWLERLSRTLGVDAYLFSTDRVSEHHAWAYAENGSLTRAFAIVMGDVVTSRGRAAPTERAYTTPRTAIDEEVVLALADEWTIDPRELEGRELGDGWIVRFSL